MFHIAICDDEPVIAEKIGSMVREKLEELGESCETSVYTSGLAFLKNYRRNLYQMILMDIDMPGVSGMDIAEKLTQIRSTAKLVFITNRADLVFDSFKYHPYQFIRKEFLEEELNALLAEFAKSTYRSKKSIEINNARGVQCLRLNDILFIECNNHNLYFVCIGEKRYCMRGTLKDFEKRLAHENFGRSHAGFLINLKYVSSINADGVLLDNGIALPLSRNKKMEFKQQYLDYMRKNCV